MPLRYSDGYCPGTETTATASVPNSATNTNTTSYSAPNSAVQPQQLFRPTDMSHDDTNGDFSDEEAYQMALQQSMEEDKKDRQVREMLHRVAKRAARESNTLPTSYIEAETGKEVSPSPTTVKKRRTAKKLSEKCANQDAVTRIVAETMLEDLVTQRGIMPDSPEFYRLMKEQQAAAEDLDKEE